MALPPSLINWILEFERLTSEDMESYGKRAIIDEDAKEGIYEVFVKGASDDVLSPVCNQLFEFYRSNVAELKLFTLEFVPVLLWFYLYSMSCSKQHKCASVESCILGIYNIGSSNQEGIDLETVMTIPSLKQPSIYHGQGDLFVRDSRQEGSQDSVPGATSHAQVRSLGELGNLQFKAVSKFPQLEYVNAQNRMTILTRIMTLLNEDIVYLEEHALESVCFLASHVALTGFEKIRLSKTVVDETELPGRINVNSKFLIEMLGGICYVMYNSNTKESHDALDAVHFRANYEQYSDVILLTNSLKHSAVCRPVGETRDVMEIGVERLTMTPAAVPISALYRATPSHVLITNASFRPLKMSEDIEIVVDENQKSNQKSIAEKERESGEHSVLDLRHRFSKPIKKIQERVSDLGGIAAGINSLIPRKSDPAEAITTPQNTDDSIEEKETDSSKE